jgi:hypothetical protein
MNRETSGLSNTKFKYIGESIIGTLVAFFIGLPLYYLDLFYPFAGTNMNIYAACGLLIIVSIYTTTGLIYSKRRFLVFLLYLASLLILKPFVYILFAVLFVDIDEVDANAFGYIMVTIYALWVILYGFLYDLTKWLNIRRNRLRMTGGNIKEFSTVRSWHMLIVAILFVAVLICNMQYEKDKRRPLQFKIEDYFIENQQSFDTLLEEVLNENQHFVDWDLDNHTQKIVINDKINVLMKKLKVYEITWHYNEQYENLYLQFKIDLEGSIPAFELWYNEDDNGQYSFKDGSLSGIPWVEGWLIYMYKYE